MTMAVVEHVRWEMDDIKLHNPRVLRDTEKFLITVGDLFVLRVVHCNQEKNDNEIPFYQLVLFW